MKTYVINIIGQPGSGKTCLAALLFAHLKMKGYVVEYASEYAKTLIWQEKFDELNNQYHVTNSQYKLFKSMIGKVEFIITDGPVIHGLYYNRYNRDNVSDIFKTNEFILQCFSEFNNINIFLERGDFKYEQAGRQQTESEANLVGIILKKLLNDYGIDYKIFKLDGTDTSAVVEYIESIKNAN
ncbi:hypothetical protein QJ856_gp0395 [Tupanvirus deep ocean]|uniref:UDP-glucose 4-epimerase n=1 Tax=Tupanvirus soda lake TaxID=2126985 RepID=A0A2K9L6X7_9VIRU|nr:hypothetical protein QJ856_gp0395 [Tupanvirus deep ocean]AUL79714.2 hypothetical protein [Tupanvirus deep ocean]